MGAILLCLAVFLSPAPAHLLWSWVMFCGLVTLLARGRFISTRLDLPILLYILSLTIAFLFSPYQKSLAKPPLYFLYFAVTQLDLNPSRSREILIAFIIGSILAFAWGLIAYVQNGADRLMVKSIGYTAIATLFLFSLGILWSWIITLPDLRVWLLLLNLPVLVGLAMTFCRAQWIAAIAQVIMLSFRRYQRLLWIGLIIVFITISALILLPHRGLEIARFKLGDPQFVSSRDVIYRGAAEAFSTVQPTGFGPGSFQSAFPLTTRFHNPVEQIGGWHNDILQSFLEGGLLALVAYLWMMIAAILGIYQSAALSDEPWIKGARWGIAIATAGVGISALLCNVATVPMVILGQTLLWGLVMGKAGVKSASDKDQPV